MKRQSRDFGVVATPSPHPSPRWGEGDDLSLSPRLKDEHRPFPPRPTGERVPEGRVRGAEPITFATPQR